MNMVYEKGQFSNLYYGPRLRVQTMGGLCTRDSWPLPNGFSHRLYHTSFSLSVSKKSRPVFSFIITGHSLGAAVLTMMVVDHLDNLRALSCNPNFQVRCYGYAPVACASLDLCEKYKEYINRYVCDLVARLS
ncbi:hypothetical protein BY458DRAFT_502632 [Sporodiniella umbellata]|nr:hypothetical protein BY458DRAFT_502632 [Sporodiniella umbellata]